MAIHGVYNVCVVGLILAFLSIDLDVCLYFCVHAQCNMCIYMEQTKSCTALSEPCKLICTLGQVLDIDNPKDYSALVHV